ncbi:SAM-dependent RNA methyltransferase [Russula aff. rugulosa BPL654]|nr:SAM-dependent RNA methyltransferase [Russula aff. rugulosa BPL654]
MVLFTYVIEHMEEDDPTPHALPRWVELEYKHMRTLAGPTASIAFTNLSSATSASLSAAFSNNNISDSDSPAQAQVECHKQGVLALMKSRDIGIPLERVCLLDPKASLPLTPSDGDAGKFTWFLFGGILGDDPPRDRTAELRALGFPTRHLGPVQMTTDTALGVTKRVIADRVPLEEIPYVDYPTIRFNARESVEMPFVRTKDEPLLPPGMKEHLHADLDQSFDF